MEIPFLKDQSVRKANMLKLLFWEELYNLKLSLYVVFPSCPQVPLEHLPA